MKTNSFATITFLSLSLAMPCAAQSVLQQMETEVSAIAQRTRSAVVTIEDSRALMAAYDTSSLEKADIQSRIALLEAEQKAAQSRLATVEQQNRVGAVDQLTVMEARNRLAYVDTELAAQRRRLESFGRQSPALRLKQEAQDQVDLLQLDRQSVVQRQATLDQLSKAGAVDQSEVEAGKLRIQRLDEQIEETTRRRNLYEQQLKSGIGANGNLRGMEQANMRKPETASADRVAYLLEQSFGSAPRSGTGFSIGDGYIVTTSDVLTGMNHPVVITDNGAKIRATVIGLDNVLNVGLVKLTAQTQIPGLKLGDSANAIEGHFAISIGNQHGQANAVALNLIAGLRTEGTDSGDHYYPALIQIGGTVGAGTSGAPLVDSHGDVIGIIAGVPQAKADYTDPTNWMQLNAGGNASTNSAMQSAARDAPSTVKNALGYLAYRPQAAPIVTSSGFAIPINEVRNVLADMKAGKAVVHGWIGVDLSNLEQATEKDGVLTVARSVKVDRVYTGAPAQRSGVQPGDVITSINDRPIHTSGDVRTSIIRLELGDTATLAVRRGNSTVTLKMKVEGRPAEYGQARTTQSGAAGVTPPAAANTRRGSQ